jgi:hypothetical protein
MVEDELEEDLNRITQDQPNYDLTVRDLVKWAESQGSLHALLMGASRSNPGNDSLQGFIQAELETLLSHNFGPITSELTQTLWHVLQQITHFDPVLEAALTTLPEGSADARKQDIEDLRNQDLNPVIKSYLLLKLLLQDYPQRQGRPSIGVFAAELQQLATAADPWQSSLSAWIEAAEQHCNCRVTDTAAGPAAQSGTAQGNQVDGYLMISVEPQPGKRTYRLKSFVQIYAADETARLLEEIPLDISDNPAEKGVLCIFPDPEQSEQRPAVRDVQEILADLVQAAELKFAQPQRKRALGYRTHTLTIEFFLPFERLGESVDLWTVPDFDDAIEIGRKCRVSVRSYDRIRRPDLLNRLEIAWENFTTLISQPNPSQNPGELFEHLQQKDLQTWDDQEINPDNKVGLKMLCPPPNSERVQAKLFRAIIRGSFPLVLWTRCAALPGMDNWDTVLDQFTTWELLRNVDELLEKIQRERKQAFKRGRRHACQCLGYHLSVMCDNPTRLPSSLEPLSEHANL